MRSLGWIVIALTASLGCVELPIARHKPEMPVPPAAKKAPAPVTADQINEANARVKAAALQEELDRAAAESTPAPIPAERLH